MNKDTKSECSFQEWLVKSDGSITRKVIKKNSENNELNDSQKD